MSSSHKPSLLETWWPLLLILFAVTCVLTIALWHP
jgi:hypothetical protein